MREWFLWDLGSCSDDARGTEVIAADGPVVDVIPAACG